MTKVIIEILEDLLHWDTCPDDYKKKIEIFLLKNKQSECPKCGSKNIFKFYNKEYAACDDCDWTWDT